MKGGAELKAQNQFAGKLSRSLLLSAACEDTRLSDSTAVKLFMKCI